MLIDKMHKLLVWEKKLGFYGSKVYMGLFGLIWGILVMYKPKLLSLGKSWMCDAMICDGHIWGKYDALKLCEGYETLEICSSLLYMIYAIWFIVVEMIKLSLRESRGCIMLKYEMVILE